MTNQWISIAGLCLIVGMLTYVAARWLASLFEAEEEGRDLSDLSTIEPHEPVFGTLTETLASQMPVSEAEEGKLTQLLRQAGYYSPRAIKDYTAIRYVAILLPVIVTALLALQVDDNLIVPVLAAGGIVTALGFSLPRVIVDARAKRRRLECERGLPVAVDLICLAIVGGQTVDSALQRVAREIRRAFPALSEELQVVRFQASVGTLSSALRQWAQRIQIPDIQNLVVLLTQAQRQGVDISDALHEYATSLRTQVRQRAESQANRANVWLIFPTILCLWLPAAMLLVGPILFELRERVSEAQLTNQQIQTQVLDISQADNNPLEFQGI